MYHKTPVTASMVWKPPIWICSIELWRLSVSAPRSKRKGISISLVTWWVWGWFGGHLYTLRRCLWNPSLLSRVESALTTGRNEPILARHISVVTPIFCKISNENLKWIFLTNLSLELYKDKFDENSQCSTLYQSLNQSRRLQLKYSRYQDSGPE